LRDLDLKGLRSRWQSVTGREAPHHLPRQLLFAIIAYRIQADVMGDLDSETVRHFPIVGVAVRRFRSSDDIDARDQE
jgi:Protein of unknown function (DUF2924)